MCMIIVFFSVFFTFSVNPCARRVNKFGVFFLLATIVGSFSFYGPVRKAISGSCFQYTLFLLLQQVRFRPFFFVSVE